MKRCNPCPNPNEICTCILHPAYSRWASRATNISGIVAAVAKRHNVSIDSLISKTRRQEIVRIRRIAMKNCRENGATLEQIGHYFGRNHSTVLYQLSR